MGFTTLAILALAGYATAKTVQAHKQGEALDQPATAPGPSDTLLGGSNRAVPRGSASTLLGGTPAPDATLAGNQAAIAAQGAAQRARLKGLSANAPQTGTPGSATPPARLQTKSLIGY